MAIDPKEVLAGGLYRAATGQERLVWIVRDGKVFYFHRERREASWLCTQPPDPAPPVEQFAAEVELVKLDDASAVRDIDDTYGAGDW